MKIYTYYEPCLALPTEPNLHLLMLWRENWSAFGFEPIVLNEYIASQHPEFEAYAARIAKFPSINPDDYDRHCWYRWAALSVAGGGIMADMDCFNYGLKAEDFCPLHDTINCGQQHIPSLVWGTKRAYDTIMHDFMRYELSNKDVGENGKVHLSDMMVLERNKKIIRRDKPVVVNHLSERWQEAKAVHFGTNTMRAHQPKHAWIEKLRNWK